MLFFMKLKFLALAVYIGKTLNKLKKCLCELQTKIVTVETATVENSIKKKLIVDTTKDF
jgi:uncharacterized protein YoxC